MRQTHLQSSIFMTNPLLQIKDLQTHFFTESGVVRAVDGVSFEIPARKTLGVLGESGCGKSVTGFSILQLINPPGRIVGGEILFEREKNGRREIVDLLKYGARSEDLRQIRGNEIAMIFQEPMTSLDPLFTVGDQLAEAVLVHQKVSKRSALDRAAELLDKVRLPQARELLKKYPHQLSGGMRQRVMIAMALSGQPKLLIADEPTTALDVTTEGQILELMRSLQEEFGMAILFITHDLGVIAEMAEEVVVMYLGKVVEKTDVQTLFESPKHPYTRALLESIPKIGQKQEGPLRTIEGMVPSPFAIPRGCPFHPRCAHFMPGVCDGAVPDEIPLEGSSHTVRCYLYSEQVEGGLRGNRV
jgi:oligopeptide/dipeptide ABC transporter ATP-binding protein